MTKKNKKYILYIWFSFIIICVVYYLYNPSAFSSENIASKMRSFGHVPMLIYLLTSVARGFTLLPSTPLILAGILLFPSQPNTVFVISVLGITLSSTLVYYFSEFLEFGEAIEKMYPQEKLRQKLESRWGALFVFFWSFFPLVPTDAVCYAAGGIKMHFLRFIVPLVLGETIICSFYVYLGSHFFEQFFG